MRVEYVIEIEGESKAISFTVDTERAYRLETGERLGTDWTRLTFHQCPNCPLHEDAFPHCPAALDLREVADSFADIISYTRVQVSVKTPEREYRKNCDAQTALLSLKGLLLATSACPILANFRGMARHHLPFASLEETIFRTTSAYLLRQYFLHQDGQPVDWSLKGLEQLYEEVTEVNFSLKQRVDAASREDANINAISALFAISSFVSFGLAHELADMKPLFVPSAPLNHP
ncbi:MAG: hypothetical protein HC918_11785 [Oscillatoriales cyanobacterium SM2_1_8]|nr:hypothetical protein [Oscillatoriales cyanobacterium SM2_1_8]